MRMNTATIAPTKTETKTPFALLNVIPLLLALVFFISLVTFPSVTGQAVSSALTMCAERLIPSIFPFMIASELLVRLEFAEITGKILGKPFKRIFGISENGAAAFVIGSLCGLPLGARYAISLFKTGRVSQVECEKLMAISNNAGIGFVVVGVGYGIWGSVDFGWLLYLCQIVAAITVGIMFFRTENRSYIAPVTNYFDKKPFPTLFCEAVSSSTTGILTVCAFAVFFTTLSSVITHACSLLSIPAIFSATLGAFSEIASGCERLHEFSLSNAPANENSAKILTFFAIGFSGLSVHAQTLSACLESEIKFKKYILLKLACGVICAFTGAIILHFVA